MELADPEAYEYLLANGIKPSGLGHIFLCDVMTAHRSEFKNDVRGAMADNRAKPVFLQQLARPEVYQLGAPACWKPFNEKRHEESKEFVRQLEAFKPLIAGGGLYRVLQQGDQQQQGDTRRQSVETITAELVSYARVREGCYPTLVSDIVPMLGDVPIQVHGIEHPDHEYLSKTAAAQLAPANEGWLAYLATPGENKSLIGLAMLTLGKRSGTRSTSCVVAVMAAAKGWARCGVGSKLWEALLPKVQEFAGEEGGESTMVQVNGPYCMAQPASKAFWLKQGFTAAPEASSGSAHLVRVRGRVRG